MTHCSIRVITNGYILIYNEDDNNLVELCFDSRTELRNFLDENLSIPVWEETE